MFKDDTLMEISWCSNPFCTGNSYKTLNIHFSRVSFLGKFGIVCDVILMSEVPRCSKKWVSGTVKYQREYPRWVQACSLITPLPSINISVSDVKSVYTTWAYMHTVDIYGSSTCCYL